jgi:hypothetical protein
VLQPRNEAASGAYHEVEEMMPRFFPSVLTTLLLGGLASAAELPTPKQITWTSETTGGAINGLVYLPPAAADKPLPAVVYQKNLSVERIGQETDEAIVSGLVNDGNLVLVLDYQHHEKAKSPTINADSLALRKAMTGKKSTLLSDYKVDGNHIFILAEGFRLARNVTFAKDGKRTLGMDIMYPAKPSRPVPLLLEFTCDNAERMGSGSLLFCHDTLVDGGQAAGFATAMADHPVAPPYKGLDNPMPDAFWWAKAAVLRAEDFARENGLMPSIGLIGFSRGGPFAAMLAANVGPMSVPPGPGGGDGDARRLGPTAVRAALIHGNRYDYLDLLPDDKMIPRFKKSWGEPTTQPLNWQLRGATNYLAKDPKFIAPMFLNTSRAESPDSQDGLAKFHTKLTELGVEHVYQVDDDQRGHQVTTDPNTLNKIYDFFHQHLKDVTK